MELVTFMGVTSKGPAWKGCFISNVFILCFKEAEDVVDDRCRRGRSIAAWDTKHHAKRAKLLPVVGEQT